MAKKIKREKVLTEDEKKAEEAKATEEAARAAAGIQDEFQAKGFELVEWMQEKQAVVLGILGAIVLAGLAVGVYTAVSSSRNTDASAALALALKSWEAPVGDEPSDAADKANGPHFKDAGERSKAARELFEKAATSHGGTGAGALAQLYVGHAALRLADYDGAAKAYQAFLDAVPKDDPLRFAGYNGLAAAQDAKGDRKGAIASLEALVNLGSETDEDAALLALGRLYVAENDPEKARKSLERIVKDFSESSLRSKAEELIATLPAAPASPESNAPSGAKGDDDESGKP